MQILIFILTIQAAPNPWTEDVNSTYIGHLLNVFFTFNLRILSRGYQALDQISQMNQFFPNPRLTSNSEHCNISKTLKTNQWFLTQKLELLQCIKCCVTFQVNDQSIRSPILKDCLERGSCQPNRCFFGAGLIVSYGEWRVTVYGVIFGELRFLDSYTT